MRISDWSSDVCSSDLVLESFMAQFYEEVPAPRLILADRVPLEAELLTQALSERTGAKVRNDVPQRGDPMTLIRPAQRNAVDAVDRRLGDTPTHGKTLRELSDLFNYEKRR